MLIITAMMKVKRSNSWSYEDFSFEDYRFSEETPTDPKERAAETERQQHENFCRFFAISSFVVYS